MSILESVACPNSPKELFRTSTLRLEPASRGIGPRVSMRRANLSNDIKLSRRCLHWSKQRKKRSMSRVSLFLRLFTARGAQQYSQQNILRCEYSNRVGWIRRHNPCLGFYHQYGDSSSRRWAIVRARRRKSARSLWCGAPISTKPGSTFEEPATWILAAQG